jgi:hypothetical protein
LEPDLNQPVRGTDPQIRIRNTENNIEVNLLLVVCQSPAPVDLAAKMAAIYNELSVKVCTYRGD